MHNDKPSTNKFTIYIARSLAAIVDTDHKRAVEAGAPACTALGVRDDGN